MLDEDLVLQHLGAIDCRRSSGACARRQALLKPALINSPENSGRWPGIVANFGLHYSDAVAHIGVRGSIRVARGPPMEDDLRRPNHLRGTLVS